MARHFSDADAAFLRAARRYAESTVGEQCGVRTWYSAKSRCSGGARLPLALQRGRRKRNRPRKLLMLILQRNQTQTELPAIRRATRLRRSARLPLPLQMGRRKRRCLLRKRRFLRAAQRYAESVVGEQCGVRKRYSAKIRCWGAGLRRRSAAGYNFAE